MKHNSNSADNLLDERSLATALDTRIVSLLGGQENTSITPTSDRPLLPSAGDYLANFSENGLVNFARLGEWFHDLFEVLSIYDCAPSEESQQNFWVPVVFGVAAASSALAEGLNYYYSKKNPGRRLEADQALIVLYSGPIFFLAYQLFLGVSTIPLWCFATVSLISFGVFIRKCISLSLEANSQRSLSFEAFDQLERRQYHDAHILERCINGARTAVRSVLSSSAVITTISREIAGKTEKLSIGEYGFVFILIGIAARIGFDQTHIPKKVDIAVALLAAFELSAWAYRGMSGIFNWSVVKMCGGSFCATDLERQLLTCFCFFVTFMVGSRALKRTRLDFVQEHEDNVAWIEAPGKAAQYLRDKRKTISNGCGEKYEQAKVVMGDCTTAGFKYAREMLSRCCASSGETPDETSSLNPA